MQRLWREAASSKRLNSEVIQRSFMKSAPDPSKLLRKLTKAVLLVATAICGSVNAMTSDRMLDELVPLDSSGPWAKMRSSSRGSTSEAVSSPTTSWYPERADPYSRSSLADISLAAHGEILAFDDAYTPSRNAFGAGSFALSALGFGASSLD